MYREEKAKQRLKSYGMFGANISSQAMLFAKSGLELLILTVLQHENQFVYPLTWAIVFALVFTAVLQVCVTLFLWISIV